MSTPNPDNIRVVVLDRAHAHFADSSLRNFFADVMALRLTGYGHEYPSQVVPIDTSDFFSTQIVTCEELPQGQLVPLSSYKMVSARRCKEYHKEFSGLSVPRGAKDGSAHAELVRQIVASAEARGEDVGYCGSWTIHPRIRQNELLTQLIRNIVYCTHLNWQLQYNVKEMLIVGVQRFKTDKYQESIGYKRLQVGDEILGPYGHPDLWDEPIAMLHLTQPSEKTLALAQRYQSYWDNRIAMGDAPAAIPRAEPEKIAEETNIQIAEAIPIRRAA